MRAALCVCENMQVVTLVSGTRGTVVVVAAADVAVRQRRRRLLVAMCRMSRTMRHVARALRAPLHTKKKTGAVPVSDAAYRTIRRVHTHSRFHCHGHPDQIQNVRVDDVVVVVVI